MYTKKQKQQEYQELTDYLQRDLLQDKHFLLKGTKGAKESKLRLTLSGKKQRISAW